MTTTVPTHDSPPVLEVRSLTKEFSQGKLLSRKSVTALRDVSFSLGKGEILSLVGESGSGNSTIARIVALLEQPTSGTFLVDGRDIIATDKRRASKAYRRQVQMVFQEPFGSLNPSQRGMSASNASDPHRYSCASSRRTRSSRSSCDARSARS